MCGHGSRLIAGILLLVSLASFSAFSAPAMSVTLSQSESDSISSALEQSTAALQASSEQIKAQSMQIKRLSIFCGVLVVGVVVDLIERAGEALYIAFKK